MANSREHGRDEYVVMAIPSKPVIPIEPVRTVVWEAWSVDGRDMDALPRLDDAVRAALLLSRTLAEGATQLDVAFPVSNAGEPVSDQQVGLASVLELGVGQLLVWQEWSDTAGRLEVHARHAMGATLGEAMFVGDGRLLSSWSRDGAAWLLVAQPLTAGGHEVVLYVSPDPPVIPIGLQRVPLRACSGGEAGSLPACGVADVSGAVVEVAGWLDAQGWQLLAVSGTRAGEGSWLELVTLARSPLPDLSVVIDRASAGLTDEPIDIFARELRDGGEGSLMLAWWSAPGELSFVEVALDGPMPPIETLTHPGPAERPQSLVREAERILRERHR